MLQLPEIRKDPLTIIAALNKRGGNYSETINHLLTLDVKLRSSQQELEARQAEVNTKSRAVGNLLKENKQVEAAIIRQEVQDFKDQREELDTTIEGLNNAIQQIMYSIPNITHESVPTGTSPTDNIVVRQGGIIPTLTNPIPHWDLVEGVIDFESGAKLTGAGFPVYKGVGARLQRALIAFFLDKASEAGYVEHAVPHMVNKKSVTATGQYPDKEGQMYHVDKDDLYLIPTAEVPLTNLYRDELLAIAELPIKLCGYTPCFRREAGTYGKEVRGLNRLHQFDKVEIVQIVNPNESYQVLETMVEHVESLLKLLELPYRVLKLCGGDMGFTSALTYDLEVYSAGQQRWLEVSSVSNFETYQANRLKLRFKDNDNRNKLAHTLNGSALALPRIMAALIENNQVDGKLVLPKAIAEYM